MFEWKRKWVDTRIGWVDSTRFPKTRLTCSDSWGLCRVSESTHRAKTSKNEFCNALYIFLHLFLNVMTIFMDEHEWNWSIEWIDLMYRHITRDGFSRDAYGDRIHAQPMNETLTKNPNDQRQARSKGKKWNYQWPNDRRTWAWTSTMHTWGSSNSWNQTQETNMCDSWPGGCWVKLGQVRKAHSMEWWSTH